MLLQVLKGSGNVREITMALARTRDGQTMLAVNDLFVGQKTHVSARYDISWNDRQESQSSSGIIISTGLGSSGWYRSVMAQASGIAEYFGAPRFLSRGLAWEERALSFVVREPFPSRRTQAGIVYGRLSEQDTFRVVSQMPENGVVFSRRNGKRRHRIQRRNGDHSGGCTEERGAGGLTVQYPPSAFGPYVCYAAAKRRSRFD